MEAKLPRTCIGFAAKGDFAGGVALDSGFCCSRTPSGELLAWPDGVDADTDWACGREADGAESSTATAIGIDTGGWDSWEYEVDSRCDVLEGENCSVLDTFVKFCSGCCTESLYAELIGEEENEAVAPEGTADMDVEYPGTVEGDMDDGEKEDGR